MNNEQIRGILDRMGIPSRLIDGSLLICLDADGDFAHDVMVWVLVEKDIRLSFIGTAPAYRPSGDLLTLANRSNSRRNFPTAVVRDGEVKMEYSFLITEEVSDQYITDCISNTITGIWSAFVDFEKDTDNQ
ncbi:MAG: hypothetical protein J6C95_00165 [Muribaculaceae bacterium]|nr:hypothetical protein [Muribaculaceae bacterium]